MKKTKLWYKKAIFYELYVRAFKDSNGDGHGDLRGAMEKLDYLQDLGINCIWLLPIFPSPLRDDGYDVADFRGIHPDYGTLQDFEDFISAAHERDIAVITDLVLNHTSIDHPWFQAARSDPDSPYHDYYVWSEDDKKYSDARIIFIDSEESNWAWDEEAQKFYWHRFFSSQPDLNYDNPAVQEEMLEVMRFWLDLGIDGFRCDAIPYLFEREETNSENLAETHSFLKRARKLVDDHYPGTILLSEANQWPEDVIPYFGEGDEMHMAFHFPVMPRIFITLKKGKVSPIRYIMEQTPPIPDRAQWCIFLRNHDELTLEMVTEEEREWMWEQYAPEPTMRLNLGIRRRLAPLLDNDIRKIALANSLLFTLPGSPVLYYGDEIGMGDNISLEDRDGVRTPMQWSDEVNAGFSDAPPEKLYSPIIDNEYGPKNVNVAKQRKDKDSIYNIIRRMIKVRKKHAAFSLGDFWWARTDNGGQVAAYFRSYRNRRLLILHNLCDEVQELNIFISPEMNGAKVGELLTGAEFGEVAEGRLPVRLEPYSYSWLKFTEPAKSE